MNLRLSDDPSRWIVRHGHPARVLGEHGLPSFEVGGRKLLAFTSLIVTYGVAGDVWMFPNRYGMVAARAPEGFAGPHPQPLLRWRPCIYRIGVEGIQGCSSQQELNWRKPMGDGLRILYSHAEALQNGEITLEEIEEITREVVDERISKAEARASELLSRCLSAQQRLEYQATNAFRVRGGRTRNLYQVELSNGFSLLDEVTSAPVLGFCLHPEYWMPDADVALATKLALEDPKLECQCLANAGHSSQVVNQPRPTQRDRIAHRLELELI